MSQLTINLPKEIEDLIDKVSARGNVPREEAIRRAFALLDIAFEQEEKGKGYSLGVVREDEESQGLEAVSRIVGVI